jgi:hypothetical protein
VGDFYDRVCTYYDTVFNKPQCETLRATWKTGCSIVQGALDGLIVGQKFGEDDWMYKGVGPAAVTGTVNLQSLSIDPTLTNVTVGATAAGTATIEGRFQITKVEPVFLTICTPSLGPITLRPTTLQLSMDNQVVTGSFNVSSFTDPASGKLRNALAFDLDPIGVTVSVDRWPIHVLLRDNAINLPCIYNGVNWWTNALADLLMVAGSPLKFSNAVDPPPARIAWADSQEQIPYAWSRSSGTTAVAKAFSLQAQFAKTPTVFSATLDNIPPQPPTPAFTYHELKWAVNAGLGASVTIGKVVDNIGYAGQIGRYMTAINPYVSLGFGKFEIGPVVGVSPGPRLATMGLLLGVAAQPISKLHPFSIYSGVRLATGSERPGQAVRFAIGAGWAFGHLTIRGCEQ